MIKTEEEEEEIDRKHIYNRISNKQRKKTHIYSRMTRINADINTTEALLPRALSLNGGRGIRRQVLFDREC